MLNQRINDEMKQAMKAGEKDRLSAIRLLRAAIKDKQIELGREPNEDELMGLIAKLVKQRKDAAEQYAAAGRSDLEAKELAEATLYETYLPEPLSDDDVKRLIDKAMKDTGAEGMRDMGKVMSALRPAVQGRTDMGRLSALVKERLQG
jgi:uncharacterized protein YqeY